MSTTSPLASQRPSGSFCRPQSATLRRSSVSEKAPRTTRLSRFLWRRSSTCPVRGTSSLTTSGEGDVRGVSLLPTDEGSDPVSKPVSEPVSDSFDSEDTVMVMPVCRSDSRNKLYTRRSVLSRRFLNNLDPLTALEGSWENSGPRYQVLCGAQCRGSSRPESVQGARSISVDCLRRKARRQSPELSHCRRFRPWSRWLHFRRRTLPSSAKRGREEHLASAKWSRGTLSGEPTPSAVAQGETSFKVERSPPLRGTKKVLSPLVVQEPRSSSQ